MNIAGIIIIIIKKKELIETKNYGLQKDVFQTITYGNFKVTF